MKAVFDIFAKWLVEGENLIYKSVILGFSISSIITFVFAHLMGNVVLKDTFPYHTLQTNTGPWFSILFIVIGASLSVIGYLTSMKSKEDIISPTRKMLVGIWRVRSKTWYIENNKIIHGYVNNVCTIGIDKVGAKLFIRFKIEESDLFEDTEFEIKNIHIHYQSEPNKITYFHEIKLISNRNLTKERNSFLMPLVGILEFSTENNKIDKMHGKWYDIDNVIYKKIVDLKDVEGVLKFQEAVKNGLVTYKGDLEYEKVQNPN